MISIFVILIIIGGIYFYLNQDEKEIIKPQKEEIIKTNNKEKKEKTISVDIKGEVMVPGIYTMKESSRVIDVIEKAGGLTENADTSVINLSKKIQDEMVIIIYSKEQILHFEETKQKEDYLQNKCINPDEYSLQNDACISNKQTYQSGKININTASKEELMTLTGIGESKAKEIISYRETNGSFQSIEEIKNVAGIGETIYAQIKENITV